MRLSLVLLLFLIIVTALAATKSNRSRGCNLRRPYAVRLRFEPEPEQAPLIINLEMDHFRIRDVPISGGSFGIEFWYGLSRFSQKLVMFTVQFRIDISWEDKRYISGNEHRIVECPDGDVVWKEENEFWLPNFYVWDVIELVQCNPDT